LKWLRRAKTALDKRELEGVLTSSFKNHPRQEEMTANGSNVSD
jgi:hypothetical protein